MENFIEQIRKERERQNNLWGVQKHSLSKFMSILLEEVGESAKEANDYDENPKESPRVSTVGWILMIIKVIKLEI